MKAELAASVWAKLASGVALAATLAGGGAIIKAAETNAVQDSRLQAVESTVEKIDSLDDSLQETSKEVALLRQALENDRE